MAESLPLVPSVQRVLVDLAVAHDHQEIYLGRIEEQITVIQKMVRQGAFFDYTGLT